MGASSVIAAPAAGPFTEEQQEYLRTLFSAAAKNCSLAGHLESGRFTNNSATGAADLADESAFFGTPVSDLCAEELWKYEANPLDAWDALLAHASENKAPDAKDGFRFKFHGLFHVAPAQDSFMLRLRIPGGVLSTARMRGLADLADSMGSGRLDITTRANLQIREFTPRNIVNALNAVRSLGMSSLGSGADNIRNFTASPLAGLDSAELIDVRPFVDAMQNYIANSRDMFGLPRKFNIAFDGGGRISTLADTNDIGFVAVRVAEGRSVPAGVYFRVLLCGITGHKQFASDCGLLLRPDQLIAVAAAMVRVFAENGDRTDRRKARLKYLVDRWGTTRFLEETERKLTFPILRVPSHECELRRSVDRTAHLGVHAQSRPGLSYIGIHVPVGWLATEHARAIADIADHFGSGEVRLTVWQNLLIPNIPGHWIDEAIAALDAAGLHHTAGTVMSGTVACTGNLGCKFAATDTKGHALELAHSLDSAFKILPPVNLHVTGCNHSCAQHYIGDIGLMGVKVNGAPGYQVNLGGGADKNEAIARELFSGLPYAKVKLALHNLFAGFARRLDKNETFIDFCGRHTIEELRTLCGPLEVR